MNIERFRLFPLACRHWTPGGLDPRFWVLFGLTHMGFNDQYCVVDDFGNLVSVGDA